MTASNTPTWQTMTELIENVYRTHGDQVAFADERTSLTYAEVEGRARAIATWLDAQGVGPGDRVVLITSNRVEYPQVEHALVIGNFVRVALADRLHPEEVANVIDDCQPTCVFAEASWLARADVRFYQRMPCPIVVIGSVDHDKITAGALSTFETAFTFEDIVSSATEQRTFPHGQPDDPVWFMYTSGTTGKPKGVVHTHASVTAMLRNVLWTFGSVSDADTAVHTAPLAHLSGAMGWAVTSVGGRNQLLGRFNPETLLDTIDSVEATVMPVVPTQLNLITDYLAESRRSISTIRLVPYAGSAITPERLELAQQFFPDTLVQLYGASEVPMPITALLSKDHVSTTNQSGLARFASAGRPAPGVEISIQDDAGHPVASGTPGEILVRSPTASLGYWNNPEATRELIDSEGFVRTGDVGMIDENGFLFIVDRKKDMIVSGGFNVYPREVENAIATMADVQEVAVVSAPDPQWGESVVAVIVPSGHATLDLADVQAHCRSQLAGYKLPRRLVLLEQLPRGATGKLQKGALTDRFWGGAERKVGG